MSERFVCVDCGQAYILSYDEQRSFREKGLYLPKRCGVCRSRRRQEGNQGFNTSTRPPANSNPIDSRRIPPSHSRSTIFVRRGETISPLNLTPSQRRSWWANPFIRFGLLSLGALLLVIIVGSWLLGFSVGLTILIYAVAINLITLLLYRYDKYVAGSERTRVPEKILLGLALLGGWPAAFIAMYQFKARHKTQKFSFWSIYWAIVSFYILLILGYLNWVGYL